MCGGSRKFPILLMNLSTLWSINHVGVTLKWLMLCRSRSWLLEACCFHRYDIVGAIWKSPVVEPKGIPEMLWNTDKCLPRTEKMIHAIFSHTDDSVKSVCTTVIDWATPRTREKYLLVTLDEKNEMRFSWRVSVNLDSSPIFMDVTANTCYLFQCTRGTPNW